MRNLLACFVTAIALILFPSVAQAASAPVTVTLGCTAVPVSTAATATKVAITEVANGKVTVAAHVAGGRTITKVVNGSAIGSAAAGFDLGTAARGKKVTVTVTAGQGALTWYCDTTLVAR